MSLQKIKIQNVKDMLKELMSIYSKMSNSKLKTEYRRLLMYIQSNRGDLKKILLHLEKQITSNQKVLAGSSGKMKSVFWKRIRDLLLKTYNMNKQIDRS